MIKRRDNMWNPTNFAEYEDLYKREVEALNIHRKAMGQSMLAYTEHARQVAGKTRQVAGKTKLKLHQRPFQNRLNGFLSSHNKTSLDDPLEYTYPFYKHNINHKEDFANQAEPGRATSQLQLCVGRPLSLTGSRPSTDMNGSIVSPRKLYPLSPRKNKLGVFKKQLDSKVNDDEDLERDQTLLEKDTYMYPSVKNPPTLKYDWGRDRNLKTTTVLLHAKSPPTEKLPSIQRRRSLSNKKTSMKLKKITLQNSMQEENHNQTENVKGTNGAVTRMETEANPEQDSDKPQQVIRMSPTASGRVGSKTPTLVLYQADPRNDSRKQSIGSLSRGVSKVVDAEDRTENEESVKSHIDAENRELTPENIELTPGETNASEYEHEMENEQKTENQESNQSYTDDDLDELTSAAHLGMG